MIVHWTKLQCLAWIGIELQLNSFSWSNHAGQSLENVSIVVNELQSKLIQPNFPHVSRLDIKKHQALNYFSVADHKINIYLKCNIAKSDKLNIINLHYKVASYIYWLSTNIDLISNKQTKGFFNAQWATILYYFEWYNNTNYGLKIITVRAFRNAFAYAIKTFSYYHLQKSSMIIGSATRHNDHCLVEWG